MIDDFDLMILLVYLIHRRAKKRNATTSSSIHSRYQTKYLKQLRSLQRRLRQRRIPRASLLDPCRSAWSTLLESGNDQALITLTGFDFNSFRWLSERFFNLYTTHSPFIDPDGRIVPLGTNNPRQTNQGGRPRLLSSDDCLGLCLAWTRTRGSNMVLQIIFGMTSTSVSMYLRFGRRILIEILKVEPAAAIMIPSEIKIQEYKDAIQEKHPLLSDVWCCMDGLKLYLQQAGESTVQNNFYNGWTHDHYVSNVIAFCPDGTIPLCCVNVPGSVHDSMVAEWGNIYEKLSSVYKMNGGNKCADDSAFSMKRYPFLVKSSQSNPPADNPAEFARGVRLNAEATAMRQSAEWGMRSLQASFPGWLVLTRSETPICRHCKSMQITCMYDDHLNNNSSN
jgi:DDE superfamily endonuclease